MPVTSVEDAKKILRIMEAIEDNDDVQDVYSNFDIGDEVMEGQRDEREHEPSESAIAAPDFTLPGTGGSEYSLADFRGKPIVLVFYPGDDTPVCTKQLNAYNEDLDQFPELDAQVRGHLGAVDRQPRGVLRQARIRLPPARRHQQGVAGAYGTLGPLGFPRRSVFIIDREGVIRYAHRAIAGLTYRPVSELIDELAKLH